MPNSALSPRFGAPLALTLFLALAACGKQQGGPQQGGGKPAEVGVVSLAPETVAVHTELAGRTAPYQIAEVRPQVGGIIQDRLFREGADVASGSALYQIDAATYQASYASAQAALARAEANVVSARAKAERYTELVKIKAVSQQDFDDATATLKQTEADVLVAKAALETARINLAYTRVTAPIGGRIGMSTVTPGALVTANQATALTTIQQLDPIYVDVTQSSSELLRLRRELSDGRLKRDSAGQAKVKLVLEDGSTYAREGKLAFSDVTVDQGTGSVTVRAVFPNPDRVLLPGMYVRAVLEQGMRENAIVVPQQGVTRDAKGNAVAMVVNAENKVEPRVLKVSQALGNRWLVDEGLKAGDRVIVEGLQRARPGAAVSPQPWSPQAATSAPAAAPAAK